MTGPLTGRIALVTGAARGQGRSHAVALARAGAEIIAVDVCSGIDSVTGYPGATPGDLAETARHVQELDRRIVMCRVDVRNRAELAAHVADAVAELGGLHVVVANAAVAPIGETTPAAFFDAVAINLGGVLTTVEVAFQYLGEGASIILIGSMAALRGMSGSDGRSPSAGTMGYVHAKRAVGRYAHDLADLVAPRGIRVNVIHPGNVRTSMLLNDAMYRVFRPDLEHPTVDDAEVGFRAMHRLPVSMIEPSDVSNAVVWLAGDTSRYVTGQQLKVEAGALLPTTPSGIPDR